MVTVFLYGPDAAAIAATEQPKWTGWLSELVDGENAAT
jgi:hypothetical protein